MRIKIKKQEQKVLKRFLHPFLVPERTNSAAQLDLPPALRLAGVTETKSILFPARLMRLVGRRVYSYGSLLYIAKCG